MFFTYLRRELRRRRKAALVVASGLALVIVVSSVSTGMSRAQDKVLESLYGCAPRTSGSSSRAST